jgi:hypothetical protein
MEDGKRVGPKLAGKVAALTLHAAGRGAVDCGTLCGSTMTRCDRAESEPNQTNSAASGTFPGTNACIEQPKPFDKSGRKPSL